MKEKSLGGSLTLLIPECAADMSKLVRPITGLYKQVFGDSIWREGMKCGVCNRNYANEEAVEMSNVCCETLLREFYSDQDIEGIITDLSLRRFVIRVVLEDNYAVAFQWGWLDELAEINRAKLNLVSQDLSMLKENLSRKSFNDNSFYYRSESGVAPLFRRRGLARLMYEDIRESTREQTRYCLSRTSPSSPQYQFSTRLGDQLVFEYAGTASQSNCNDNRVLFAGVL